MNVLTISPHPDDAVFGCGAYLAAEPGHVVTVFGGRPRPGFVTPYDEACGFSSSAEAMGARYREDAAALTVLGCERHGLHHLDCQYGEPQPTPHRLAEELTQLADIEGAEGLLGPLGIQHPDHVLVSEACLVAAEEGMAVWLYEELPYRIMWPELACDRTAEVALRGWDLVADFLGGGPLPVKERAIGCYASQEVDLHCCLVPERFWRLVPCD